MRLRVCWLVSSLTLHVLTLFPPETYIFIYICSVLVLHFLYSGKFLFFICFSCGISLLHFFSKATSSWSQINYLKGLGLGFIFWGKYFVTSRCCLNICDTPWPHMLWIEQKDPFKINPQKACHICFLRTSHRISHSWNWKKICWFNLYVMSFVIILY